MTTTTDEKKPNNNDNPGFRLRLLREKQGLTREQVAVKLHLRARIIELLEADDYAQMPEPVFIMGYFRAYAKLLGVAPDPYIEVFNNSYTHEKKPEKALWQSKRESNKSELIVRLLTTLVAISAIIAICYWWQTNKDKQALFPPKQEENINAMSEKEKEPASGSSAPVHLTDISRIQSLFANQAEASPLEKASV